MKDSRGREVIKSVNTGLILMLFHSVLFPAFSELDACQHFCKVTRFNVLFSGPGGVFNIKMMHQDRNQSLLLSGSRYQCVNMRPMEARTAGSNSNELWFSSCAAAATCSCSLAAGHAPWGPHSANCVISNTLTGIKMRTLLHSLTLHTALIVGVFHVSTSRVLSQFFSARYCLLLPTASVTRPRWQYQRARSSPSATLTCCRCHVIH